MLAAIALVPARQARAARRDPRAAVRALRRGGRGARRASRRSRATRATRTRCHLYVVRIDAERAGATRDEYQRALADELDRDEHPLPARAPAHVVPRAFRRATARSPSAPAPRCCRCRSRPRTPTTTSATRSTRCAASTRGSPDEASTLVAMRRALRLVLTLGVTGLAVAYIVWKIDLSKTWHVLAHASLGWFLLSLTIMGVTVWPMAWRWQRLLRARGDPRPARVARPRVLHVVHGRADPADVDRRRRDADLRDVAAASRAQRADRRAPSCSSARSAARRRSRSPRSGSCSRSASYDVGAVHLDRGGVRRRDRRARGAAVLAPRAAAAGTVRPAAAPGCGSSGPLRSVYEAIHAYRNRRGCSSACSR